MKLIIYGKLPSLNEYVEAERSNRYKASALKRKTENNIRLFIKEQKIKPIEEYPILIRINWYEKDNRRDVDNVIFAKKFILDALVGAAILKDDSRKYVKGFIETVLTDTKEPRIEIEFMEVK